MDKINTQMLDEFYNDKLDEGLSPKSVKELHNLLNRAFSQAVKSLVEDQPGQ